MPGNDRGACRESPIQADLVGPSVGVMTTPPHSSASAPAHGKHTDHGRPHAFSSVTPFIAVQEVQQAIAFYEDVLGARQLDATEIDGVVVHAELQLSCGRLQLGQPQSAYHLTDQPDGDEVCFSLGVYVTDVDAAVARAIAAGAHLREEVVTFVSGDRFASIRDPFGVRWSVMTRVEDLSPEESARRVAAWAAEQG